MKTGGGHLAPARAVYNYMKKYCPDTVDPVLIYGFEKVPRWVRSTVEGGYRILQYKSRWFFEFLYALNKIPIFGELSCRSVSYYIRPYLENILLNEKPDKIVVFHFFLIHATLKILKEKNLNIPVITFITDPFTPHPMWFLRKKQSFIAFSERLKNRIQSRLSHSRVNNFHFVLDEKFSYSMDKSAVTKSKEKLGYSQDKKVILILGGGDGIPKGKRILKELLDTKPEYELALVCGRNESLLKNASKLKNKYSTDNLKIYGYVDFIYELLNISDMVITKCGASTIMEILNLKKVPIVNNYIWEQEQGNVDFLTDNKLGIYEPDIKKLPAAINNLLTNDEFYKSFVENIMKNDIKNGLEEVVDFLTS